MQAPASNRSKRLGSVLWIYFGLWAAGSIVAMFGPMRISVDRHDPVFWLSLVLSLSWLAVVIAYATSRLIDLWDQEARARGGRRRTTVRR